MAQETKRVRYMGRDFDIYYLNDERDVIDSHRDLSEIFKYAASTGCTFDSVATYETVTDKSTPASGLKQLQRIDWTLSSQYNVTSINGIKNLLDAHRTGTAIYVVVAHARVQEDIDSSPSTYGLDLGLDNPLTGKVLGENTDAFGSPYELDAASAGKPMSKLVSGYCVIKSIKVDAQDGQLATFSIELEGSGDYDLYGSHANFNVNTTGDIVTDNIASV